jgi:glycosyltransferase involved in cell wall biosynthesis
MSLPLCLNITAHVDERFGGLTTSLPAFCEALQHHGRYHSCLCAFCDADEQLSSAAAGFDVTVFPFGRLRWAFDRTMRSRLKHMVARADVVHVHGMWQEHCALGTQFSRQSHIPYMISAHGMLDRWALRNRGWKKRAYWSLIDKFAFEQASCLRALTQNEAEDYRRMGVTTPVAIIPNGVTIPAMSVSTASFFETYPELRDKRLVLFLGRIHKKKGVHLLCEAWAGIARQFPDTHLVIAGPDSEGTLSSVRSIVSERGIGSTTTFTGMLRGEAKWAALRAAWVFVLPSFSEGFSIAVLEALGVGTPTVISHACYFPEVSETGAGWIIKPEVEHIRKSLIDCLHLSPAEHTAISRRARQLIEERYTWRAVGEKTSAVLDWMLGGVRPACTEILGLKPGFSAPTLNSVLSRSK